MQKPTTQLKVPCRCGIEGKTLGYKATVALDMMLQYMREKGKNSAEIIPLEFQGWLTLHINEFNNFNSSFQSKMKSKLKEKLKALHDKYSWMPFKILVAPVVEDINELMKFVEQFTAEESKGKNEEIVVEPKNIDSKVQLLWDYFYPYMDTVTATQALLHKNNIQNVLLGIEVSTIGLDEKPETPQEVVAKLEEEIKSDTGIDQQQAGVTNTLDALEKKLGEPTPEQFKADKAKFGSEQPEAGAIKTIKSIQKAIQEEPIESLQKRYISTGKLLPNRYKNNREWLLSQLV